MGIRDAPALGCSIDVHDAQVRVGSVIKTGCAPSIPSMVRFMAQGDSCPPEVCVTKAAREHVIQYFCCSVFLSLVLPCVGPGINIIPALIKPPGNPCTSSSPLTLSLRGTLAKRFKMWSSKERNDPFCFYPSRSRGFAWYCALTP